MGRFMVRMAKKDDLKNLKPLPAQRDHLNFEMVYTDKEYSYIKLGLIPQLMEDKWFIYWDNDWIYFHRSWTGVCIFQVRLEKIKNGYKVSEAWVNRNQSDYAQTNNASDIQALCFLIDRMLLCKNVSVETSSNPASAVRVFSSFGHVRGNRESIYPFLPRIIKHNERCKKCKDRVYELLCSSFGEVTKNYNLHLSTRLEDYSNLSHFQSLPKIYKSLQEFRGYRNFVRAKHLSRADFFVMNPGFIVEFDESQHFTAQRKIALKLYSSSLSLGFDRNKWITLCEKTNKHDNDRNCIHRDEQRAWYDTLKDVAPDILGLRPTARLYAKNLAWCKLDPSSKKDQDLFKEVLYGPCRL